MRRHLMLALVIGAAMLAGCGLSGGGDGVQSGVQEGQQLPDAEFTRLEGGKIKVSDLRGRPAVINFWATWCGPCKEEIPLLQQAYGAGENATFQIIAVTDESRGEVSTFVEGSAMSLPVVLDAGGQAGQRYRIQGIPTTFFLDSEGVIVIRHTGTLTPGTLQVFLEQITGDETAPAAPAPTGAPAEPARTPAPLPTPSDSLVGSRPSNS